MELREYWSIIRRRWWLPVAITLVALVASTAVGRARRRGLSRPTCGWPSAPSRRLTRTRALYYDPTYYSNLDSEYLADDMSEFMTSRAFADEVQRELATSSTPIDVDVDVDHERDADQEDAPLHRHHAHHRRRSKQGAADRRLDQPHPQRPRARGALPEGADRLQHPDGVVTPPVTHRANTPLGLVSEIGLRTLIGLLVGIGAGVPGRLPGPERAVARGSRSAAASAGAGRDPAHAARGGRLIA